MAWGTPTDAISPLTCRYVSAWTWRNGRGWAASEFKSHRHRQPSATSPQVTGLWGVAEVPSSALRQQPRGQKVTYGRRSAGWTPPRVLVLAGASSCPPPSRPHPPERRPRSSAPLSPRRPTPRSSHPRSRPRPPRRSPDPDLRALLAKLDQRIEATVESSCRSARGTRCPARTTPSAASARPGTGSSTAAGVRRRLRRPDDREKQSFVQPVCTRIPVPTVITNVIATLRGATEPNRSTWCPATTTHASPTS